MMARTNRRMRLCCVLLCLNLAFIWGNSLLPAEASAALSGWVKSLIQRILPNAFSGSGGGGLLRKAAHFSEFACLGALLTWLFGMLGRKLPLPLMCGVLCACIDETIQRFSPGRCPSLRDVCIDTAGVALGMFLLTAGNHIQKYYKHLEETK